MVSGDLTKAQDQFSGSASAVRRLMQRIALMDHGHRSRFRALPVPDSVGF